jgi:hypothetical protein
MQARFHYIDVMNSMSLQILADPMEVKMCGSSQKCHIAESFRGDDTDMRGMFYPVRISGPEYSNWFPTG